LQPVKGRVVDEEDGKKRSDARGQAVAGVRNLVRLGSDVILNRLGMCARGTLGGFSESGG